MIFCFSAATVIHGVSQFSYQFDQLEKGLEFLNKVVMQGDKLISVYLIEGGKRTSLPIEAFDGVSFLSILKELEIEWKYLLRKPSSLHNMQAKHIHWYKEKLVYYEQHIINLELMINDISRHCEQQGYPFISNDEIVIARYRSIFNRYKSQSNQAHLIRDFLLTRIYAIEPSFEV